MVNKKNNTFLIRLSDKELGQLNDGWFLYVKEFGRPISKNEYIRKCIQGMLRVLQKVEED